MSALVPLAAEPIFQIGSLPVTNSMINAWVAVLFFIVVAGIASRRRGLAPRGIHNVIEMVIEGALGEVEKVTSDRARAKRFLPLVATIFLFILVSNWMGLIPGVGSFGVYETIEGHRELVPLFRAATSDLNLTLAIAAFTILYTHVTGLATIGVFNHVSKFFNLRGIVQSLRRGPIAVLVAVVEFFVGLLEIIGEFAKTLSLALRLFGNIFAGEVLITVIMSIFSLALPIPFIFLEILVGIIQATVFAMLTLAFLVMATTDHGEHDQEHDSSEEQAHAPSHAHA